jgi:hypothetical protein
MLAYTRQFRDSDAPFDVVVGGTTSGTDNEKDRDRLAQIAEVGVTWWVESPWPPLTFDDVRARLEQGPPRI